MAWVLRGQQFGLLFIFLKYFPLPKCQVLSVTAHSSACGSVHLPTARPPRSVRAVQNPLVCPHMGVVRTR